MSDFSDRPLVAGSITGLRSFRVDSLGRLTGYTHKAVFTPGENVGECRKDEDTGGMWSFLYPGGGTPAYARGGGFIPNPGTLTLGVGEPMTYHYSTTPPTIVDEAPGVKAVTRKKPVHRVGNLTCSCGFYAYFDGRNDYHSKGEARVAALIEGYGTVTVGMRGFRSEKARLVALIVPSDPQHRHARLFERVRHNYAGTPVYAKRRDALAAHPLTAPDPLTPETCDDFWTRSAQ